MCELQSVNNYYCLCGCLSVCHELTTAVTCYFMDFLRAFMYQSS